MQVKIKAHIEIKDKNGKVVKKMNRVCHSYVIGFGVFLAGFWRGNLANGSFTITDTSNTTKTILAYSAPWGSGVYWAFSINANSGESSYGVMVGTGENAVSMGDYNLQTKIAHGSATGQVQYGSTSVGTADWSGSVCSFTIARTFTNITTSDINVKEIGLAAKSFNMGTTTAIYILLERSALNFIIGAGQSATVTYTVSNSV